MKIYQTMNLEPYFNHKIIGNEQEIRSKGKVQNFGVKNNLFLPDIFPDIAKGTNIPFENKKIVSDEYDNMQCEGQEIIIEQQGISKIIFLGLCACGDIGDAMQINILNKKTVEKKLFFYDWIVTNLDERWEYDIWNDACHMVLEAHVSANKKRRIYQYECMLERTEQNVNSIIFPYNPLLHILAITLEIEK